jgi:hypothetical protein
MEQFSALQNHSFRTHQLISQQICLFIHNLRNLLCNFFKRQQKPKKKKKTMPVSAAASSLRCWRQYRCLNEKYVAGALLGSCALAISVAFVLTALLLYNVGSLNDNVLTGLKEFKVGSAAV